MSEEKRAARTGENMERRGGESARRRDGMYARGWRERQRERIRVCSDSPASGVLDAETEQALDDFKFLDTQASF